MNNQLTILLNDKEFIKDLLLDEEVKVVLKDKLIKAVITRLVKGDNTPISPLEGKITNEIKDTIVKECFTNAFDRRLKDSFKEEIKTLINNEVTDVIKTEKVEAVRLLEEKMQNLLSRLDSAAVMDEAKLNYLLRERIDAIVKQKIDKLMSL